MEECWKRPSSQGPLGHLECGACLGKGGKSLLGIRPLGDARLCATLHPTWAMAERGAGGGTEEGDARLRTI